MPLAKYITDFIDTKESEAISLVENEFYDESELVSLYRHEKRPRVLVAIGNMMSDESRAKYAPALVEKSKLDTMSNLQPLAAQINEKYARFEVVEKEATMLMLEIGLAVEYVKEQLPHGQLMKWTQDNLTITHRHANRFRQLAQVFIKANNLKEDEAFLLCDPANSKQALGEKLRQMAFDFLGDRTQAELFEQYKIKGGEPKQLPAERKSIAAPLPPGETKEHVAAKATWDSLAGQIELHGLTDRDWAHLRRDERETLYDIVNELAKQLRESLKG